MGGRWKLSASDIGNRKGYAGYEHDGDGGVPELAHVRNRVLHFGLGRWTRRDPLGYNAGKNLHAYSRSMPIHRVDPFGLVDQSLPCAGGACEFNLPISPDNLTPKHFPCAGNKCTDPPNPEDWPAFMQWLWNTLWVTVEGSNPIPTGTLSVGPDIFRLYICQLVRDYEASHPEPWNELQDPDYLLLYALCRVANRTTTMRSVCCQDLGPSDSGPPSPSISAVPCPKSYSDAECCAFAAPYGTTHPVPSAPGTSSCSVCGTPGIDCVRRRWGHPSRWPGRLP